MTVDKIEKTDIVVAPKEDQDENKLDIDVVDEDDEFEEFPLQDWQSKEDNADEEELNVWEDNWDDEVHENDFSIQLREELTKKQFLSSQASNPTP